MKRLLIVLVFLQSSAAFALPFIGRVLRTQDGQPIADAKVVILETKKSAFTDEQGAFSLDVPETGYYT
ncbi:MAG TPA: carboxypeptidase-like regulatory domain-containing protein, partial [Leptospiraceae bacterium]|nr:carboxypeptidase-like regulatory domain-containing protein [Leptospiraceae bacterium]